MAKLSLRQLTLYAMLGALTFGLKFAMSSLPNIEPVSLMILLFGAVLGRKGLYPLYVYVGLELLVYGLGQWNVMYLYIWLVPLLLGISLRKLDAPLGWAVTSAAFGLSFGALCAPVDVVMGGFGYAASKWVSGIPFDLLHCGGNFVMALLLFMPLRKILERLYCGLK